ncbi:MAG: DUF4091 domain-containing protein [Phycisphaerae bacterium]|nr:DUF4091 domain-containing protein [Phycisphaerae bacterium]
MAFQVVLRGAASDRVVQLTVTDLTGPAGTIPADDATLYRALPVRIDAYPAWYLQRTPNRREVREYPDVLVPIVAGSTALPAELHPVRNTAFWVDWYVRPGTAAGTYTGRLRAETESTAAEEVTIAIEVWPFALPAAPHMVALAPLEWSTLVAHHLKRDGEPYRPHRLAADDPLRPAALGVLDATFRLLHAHRCHGILTDLRPNRRLGSAEGELDWADYDAAVAGYLDGSTFDDRVALPVWTLPVDDRYPTPLAYGGVGSDRYAEAVRATTAACVAHFRQQGWLDRSFVPLFASQAQRGDEHAAFRAVAELFRAVDPMAPRLWCGLPPQSMEPFGWFGHPFVDPRPLPGSWCPPARFVDAATIPALRQASAQVWWQPDQPPYSGSTALVSPPIDVRSIGWQAARWDVAATWLTGAADWPAEAAGDSIADQATATSRWLIYPGEAFGLDAPVPSVRLKHLRRGLQDAEYLWLLRQQDRPAVADLVAEALFAFGGTAAFGEHHLDGRAYGWVQDPAMWRLGRELLAAELLRVAAGESAEGFEQFRRRLEWQRFLLGTRLVRGWVDGVRIRPEPGAAETVRVEANVAMLNQTSHAARAVVECSPLPAGWELADKAPRFEVPPGQLARRMLTMRLAQGYLDIPSSTGVMPLPITLSDPPNLQIDVPARVAVLTAQRVARPLTIDGRLDDWLPGFDNVAGDFVLVGAQDVPKRGTDEPDRPLAATLAFVACDDEALYLAFNAAAHGAGSRAVTQTNFVRYEGMTPVGEDLVEIVLDPGAAATGPGDLYHVVVKANGAIVTGRGIACDPPIGPYERWPAEVAVGIDADPQSDRWFVEVRLAFSSFGRDVKQHRWWGINFARLHHGLGEYSTWSAARWNVYSPATLGNLHLPR